jgi:hypothetical protein
MKEEENVLAQGGGNLDAAVWRRQLGNNNLGEAARRQQFWRKA